MTGDDEKIRYIPSIEELEEMSQSLQRFKRAFPALKPMLKALDVNVESAEAAFEDFDIDRVAEDVEKLAATPDAFNEHFADRGWIMHENMNLDVAQDAVELAEEGRLDEAEALLVDYYDSDTVEFQLNRMKQIDAFLPRWPLARNALEDYEEGRYHACVPVVLAMTDGLVQQVFVDVEGEGKNFSAEETSLKAWDSIAAHSKGLGALRDVVLTSRKTTRTEEIPVPYRHGIMHGMDLGYDNELVAAKAWSILFAVGEWARKAEAGELEEPNDEEDPSLLETLQETRKTMEETKRIREAAGEWEPRNLSVGVDVPAQGEPEDYPEGTPERALVELLHYWTENNYGYMAQRLLDFDGNPKDPGDVRMQFEGFKLQDFRLVELEDTSPVFTDITVQLEREFAGERQRGTIQMRMTRVDSDGNPAIQEQGTWTTHTDVNLLSSLEGV